MADEAVVRILVQGTGAISPFAAGGATGTPAGAPAGSSSQRQNDHLLERIASASEETKKGILRLAPIQEENRHLLRDLVKITALTAPILIGKFGTGRATQQAYDIATDPEIHRSILGILESIPEAIEGAIPAIEHALTYVDSGSLMGTSIGLAALTALSFLDKEKERPKSDVEVAIENFHKEAIQHAGIASEYIPGIRVVEQNTEVTYKVLERILQEMPKSTQGSEMLPLEYLHEKLPLEHAGGPEADRLPLRTINPEIAEGAPRAAESPHSGNTPPVLSDRDLVPSQQYPQAIPLSQIEQDLLSDKMEDLLLQGPGSAPSTGLEPIEVEKDYHLLLDDSNKTEEEFGPPESKSKTRGARRGTGGRFESKKKDTDINPEHGGHAFASGGTVGDHPGGPRGTDTIPAWLSEGEFVVNADAAQQNRGLLESINNNTKGMSGGGPVDYLAEGSKPGLATRGVNLLTGFLQGGLKRATMAAGANSDPSIAVDYLGNMASQAGQAIGTVVPVVGAVVTGAGELTKSFAGLMQAVDKTVERYGQYSPEIAQAQAMAEVAQTLGDMERAQRAGGELAKYVESRSELEQKVEEIKVTMLTKMLPGMIRVVDMLEKVVDNVAVKGILENWDVAVFGILAALQQILGNDEDEKKRKRIEDLVDPTTEILGNANFQEGGAWVPKL